MWSFLVYIVTYTYIYTYNKLAGCCCEVLSHRSKTSKNLRTVAHYGNDTVITWRKN